MTCASLLRDVTSRFVLFFFTKVVKVSGEAPQSLQWFQTLFQNSLYLIFISKSRLEAVTPGLCCEIITHHSSPPPALPLFFVQSCRTLCIYTMSSEIMEDRVKAVLMSRTGPDRSDVFPLCLSEIKSSGLPADITVPPLFFKITFFNRV